MSRAERLFGKKLRLPSSFFNEQSNIPSYSDPDLLKSLLEYFNSRDAAPINTKKCYKKSFVDTELFSCPAVYMRIDRVKKGLEPSFTGPFKIQKRFDKYFTIETPSGVKNISLDRLKPAHLSNNFQEDSTNNNHCLTRHPSLDTSHTSDLSQTEETTSNTVPDCISDNTVPKIPLQTCCGRLINPPNILDL